MGTLKEWMHIIRIPMFVTAAVVVVSAISKSWPFQRQASIVARVALPLSMFTAFTALGMTEVFGRRAFQGGLAVIFAVLVVVAAWSVIVNWRLPRRTETERVDEGRK